MPIRIIYNGTSEAYNFDYMDMNVTVNLTKFSTTNLTEFVNENYIESIIVFTVLTYVPINGTKLECSIADLDNDIKLLDGLSGMYQFHSSKVIGNAIITCISLFKVTVQTIYCTA